MSTIEADYLVGGAGAMGVTFTPTMVTETSASVVLVDRNHQPGGHWTTANGLERRPPTAVFDADHVTPQTVRGCQQVFSAALIAHVEAAYHDDAIRNDFCVPVPHPDTALDWLHGTIGNYRNDIRWLEEPELVAWLDAARLDLIDHLGPPKPAEPQARVSSTCSKSGR